MKNKRYPNLYILKYIRKEKKTKLLLEKNTNTYLLFLLLAMVNKYVERLSKRVTERKSLSKLCGALMIVESIRVEQMIDQNYVRK